jgi:hypothetical protein
MKESVNPANLCSEINWLILSDNLPIEGRIFDFSAKVNSDELLLSDMNDIKIMYVRFIVERLKTALHTYHHQEKVYCKKPCEPTGNFSGYSYRTVDSGFVLCSQVKLKKDILTVSIFTWKNAITDIVTKLR